MAVAAAAGALLIMAAGAVPAYASAPVAPPGGHPVTITAQPAAGAPGGIGPQATLPCATKDASCVPQTIECTIYAPAPFANASSSLVGATAHVACTSSVTSISLNQVLWQDSLPAGSDNDTESGPAAATAVGTACQPGTYFNAASALITFPAGYILTGGTNPIHDSSTTTVTPSMCMTGGGPIITCSNASPSRSAQPAARHPDLIVCP
jgi:hypothetical protein